MIGISLGWNLLCGSWCQPWVALDCWSGDVLARGMDLGLGALALWPRWPLWYWDNGIGLVIFGHRYSALAFWPCRPLRPWPNELALWRWRLGWHHGEGPVSDAVGLGWPRGGTGLVDFAL